MDVICEHCLANVSEIYDKCPCCGKEIDYRTRKDYPTLLTKAYPSSRWKRLWAKRSYESHISNGYDLLFTLEEFLEIVMLVDECPICGSALDYTNINNKSTINTPSMDRVNNNTKIKLDEIAIICHKCNATKSNRTMDEFLEYCKNVVRNYE